MNLIWRKLSPLLLIVVLLLAACDGDNNNVNDNANLNNNANNLNTNVESDLDTEMDVEPQTETDAESDMETAATHDEALTAWLQRVNQGELETANSGDTLDWGYGYVVYYGAMESIGVDNLIYNALEVRRRLDTGEVTEENLTQADENLLTLAEGIAYESGTDLTQQVAQTPEIRNEILAHAADSQANLSPQDALDSDNIVGVIAPPAPESIGQKYLVYTQDSPDAEFTFEGVILAVDATNTTSAEPYSVDEWNGLTWLGDAGGPFWDDLPAGVSGNPDDTTEGRPGVLLISENTYEQITSGTFTE